MRKWTRGADLGNFGRDKNIMKVLGGVEDGRQLAEEAREGNVR